MNDFRDVQAHVYRARGRNQWNPRVVSQLLANRSPIADQQSESGRVGTRFTANAFRDFCYSKRGQRSFFRRLPNSRITANGCERGVPRPNRDGKIQRGDHCNNPEWMPLLHQTMVRSLRLDRQAIKHARLTECEVADVDHFLYFAFALRDNLSGLKRHELPELMFRVAKRVAETADGLAAHRSRRCAPFQKRFVRAGDGRLVILVGRRVHAGEFSAIDRVDLDDLATSAAPFTAKHAGVFLSNTEFFENRLHDTNRGVKSPPRLKIIYGTGGSIAASNPSLRR